MNNDYLLTVLVITYNHKDYIRDCVEGILKQKTTFDFQILIHDDASTDGTTEILKEYAEKYPDKIELMLEEENAYSRGIDLISIVRPRVKGHYLAQCDGDDYWTDEDKLQLQVDFLKSHPEYMGCAHVAKYLNVKDNTFDICPSLVEDKALSSLEVFEWNSKNRFQTATLMSKAEYILDAPLKYKVNGSNDYANAVWIAVNGPIYIINRCMSVYRMCTQGSYSESIGKMDMTARNKINRGWIKILDIIDEDLHFEYTKELRQIKRAREANYLIQNRRYFRAWMYLDIWIKKEKLSFFKKLFLHTFCPFLYNESDMFSERGLFQ